MEWFNSLFIEHSAMQAVIIMAVIIALGLGLGKLRIGGISLGMTCVFFAGILIGHLGFSIDPAMLKYAESFGLVLFVYELGLQVGPIGSNRPRFFVKNAKLTFARFPQHQDFAPENPYFSHSIP